MGSVVNLDEVINAARGALRDAAVKRIGAELSMGHLWMADVYKLAILVLYLDGKLGRVAAPPTVVEPDGRQLDLVKSFVKHVGAERLILAETHLDHPGRSYSRMTKADKARWDAMEYVQMEAGAFLKSGRPIRVAACAERAAKLLK